MLYSGTGHANGAFASPACNKAFCLQVRDWYVESFKDLRDFPTIKDDNDEQKFTELLKHIYHRHRHVVPVMAMGVAELKKELQKGVGLLEMPEIHQFLDGFYLSRIGIRILIGQHIALHEPEKENYIGKLHVFWSSCGTLSVAGSYVKAVTQSNHPDAVPT